MNSFANAQCLSRMSDVVYFCMLDGATICVLPWLGLLQLCPLGVTTGIRSRHYYGSKIT